MSDIEDIKWEELPFGYLKTDYNVEHILKMADGAALKFQIPSTFQYIWLPLPCTTGRKLSEGMKAFRGVDGKIRVFRWDENAKRLINSARGIMMEPVPMELFKEAVWKVIKLNERFVPPYGTGASLYIRPLLFGSGAQVGVKPATEYTFVVFVTPVGPYFKEGFKPVKMQIVRDFDRAAPLGTGTYKVGGNYAASLQAGERAHREGYKAALFLDSKEKKYIDEAGPANFFGIKTTPMLPPNPLLSYHPSPI